MIGQQIGNYRLVRLLGSGGMGMVYEAVHDGIGGRAAIKVLRPEVAISKDATQRFFSEARAANLIAHPGIVHIFDCGYTASGGVSLRWNFAWRDTATATRSTPHLDSLRDDSDGTPSRWHSPILPIRDRWSTEISSPTTS